MKKIFVILLCVLSIGCFSQNANVVVQQDSRVEQLIQRQKDIHLADNTIDGYRIQIFMESGNDAVEHANIMMEEFKEKYPDIPIYLVFGQPYYRLRVGDYRIIFDKNGTVISIYKIDNRGEVYKRGN